uniref:Uncharacterized protein n=1 Tax=Pithovirus LCDPAC01 TaxID=2506600 RepID=A0A481YMP2_9VIRU|nr:MAG: hypothetical protein LCDPAC01_01210 [Pithovirus LCDPAC01]
MNFTDCFDSFLDVANKITRVSSHGIDVVGTSLRRYINIWERTKKNPEKHISLVKELALRIKKETKDLGDMESVVTALEESKYKIVALSKKKRPPTIYISIILSKAFKISEDDDYEAEEKSYADIYILDLLRCFVCSGVKGFEDVIDQHEKVIGIDHDKEVVADSSFSGAMKGFVEELTGDGIGDSIDMSKIQAAMKDIMSDKGAKKMLKGVIGDMGKAKNMKDMFGSIMSRMKDVEMPPELLKSIEATVNSVDE